MAYTTHMKQTLTAFAMLAAVIFTSSCSTIDPMPEATEKIDFQVFLLAGQSNMAGRGLVTEADREVHPRVLMLTKDGTWQYAVDPVHYDKKRAGAGLGRSFALELVKRNPDITIGLVPAACGGSPISTWTPGGYHAPTDSHPYDDAIERTRRAMDDGKLAGILWHQGESDSRPERAQLYKERLIELIARFRTDLDAPDVPFVIGQLGQFEAKPWTEARQQVNQAQIEVAREVPYSAFVSSEGLSSMSDNTHFNTESLHEFGRRYAESYLEISIENRSSVSD